MPRYTDPDPELPCVITAVQAYAAGLTRDQVRQRVRSGRWLVLARGVYHRDPVFMNASPEPTEFATQRQQHVDLSIAKALALPGCVLALHSAAAVHGLPLVGPWMDHVALNAPFGSWNGRRPGVVIHRMTLGSQDIVEDGVPLTSVARTCIDISRLCGTQAGLIVSDAALRAGFVTSSLLLGSAHHTVDTRRVRQGIVVAHCADAQRESPGESASWAYFLRHRLRLPRMQVEIPVRAGRRARVDFLWEDVGVIGEFDGRLKYQSPADVYEEKLREDALRAEGFQVVRWGWTDLSGPNLAISLRRILTPASKVEVGMTPDYGIEKWAG